MNQSITIQVEKLLMKKQLDKLSEAEREELEELFRQYPEAKALQQAVEEDFSEGKLTTVYQMNDPQLTLPEIQDKIRTRKRRTAFRKMAVAASLVLLTGIGGALAWKINQPEKTIEITADQHTVRLQLANGRSILLDKAQQQTISSGAATASANNKLMSLQGGDATGGAMEWNTLHVPRKLDYTITLQDGSTVRLNAGTQLKFPFSFSGKTREVYVDGEAYFIIKKAASQPFIVHTPNGDIRVLGTEFNVNTYNRGITKASLVQGAIAFKKGTDSVRLRPGTEVVAEGDQHRITDFEKEVTLSWMNGIFFFHNAPLSEIADMINRWFDVPVVIDNPELASQLFTGNLDKSRPLEAFLQLLKNTVDARYYYTDNVLHISK
jgi:ferric-dicitrate binding protein FerR (iron transport regulator)